MAHKLSKKEKFKAQKHQVINEIRPVAIEWLKRSKWVEKGEVVQERDIGMLCDFVGEIITYTNSTKNAGKTILPPRYYSDAKRAKLEARRDLKMGKRRNPNERDTGEEGKQ